MEEITMKVLSKASNASIVQLPWRNYPSFCIQGDSLKILHSKVSTARKLLEENDLEELKDELEYIFDILDGYLQHYKNVTKLENYP
jgi:hypothetical protein